MCLLRLLLHFRSNRISDLNMLLTRHNILATSGDQSPYSNTDNFIVFKQNRQKATPKNDNKACALLSERLLHRLAKIS